MNTLYGRWILSAPSPTDLLKGQMWGIFTKMQLISDMGLCMRRLRFRSDELTSVSWIFSMSFPGTQQYCQHYAQVLNSKGVGTSPKVRGPVKRRCRLEQKLTPLRHIYMQFRALLVLANHFPHNNCVFKKEGNDFKIFFGRKVKKVNSHIYSSTRHRCWPLFRSTCSCGRRNR